MCFVANFETEEGNTMVCMFPLGKPQHKKGNLVTKGHCHCGRNILILSPVSLKLARVKAQIFLDQIASQVWLTKHFILKVLTHCEIFVDHIITN